MKDLDGILKEGHFKTVEIKPSEKTKVRKSDIIIFTKAKWDAVTPKEQDKFLNIYEYASPYKAIGYWQGKLFANNPEFKYNNEKDLNELGQVLYKADKSNTNKPRFAFIINKNMSDNTSDKTQFPEKIKETLEKDLKMDTPENIMKWYTQGIEDLSENLLRNFPILKRILIPIRTFKDFPNELWNEVLNKLTTLNNHFVNIEVILMDDRETEPEEDSEKINVVNIENTQGESNFPVIKITGKINHINIRALIDSGAACSVIYLEDAKKALLEVKTSQVKLRTANNMLLNTGGYTIAPFQLKDGDILNITAQCVKDTALRGKLIIGLDFLKQENAQINCGELSVYLPKRDLSLKGQESKHSSIKYVTNNTEINKFKIKLTQNEVIEAHTMKLVQVKSKRGKVTGKYLLDPCKQWDHYIAPMIVEFNKEGIGDIAINNDNRYPLSINKLHILGKLTQIEDKETEIKPSIENIAILNFLSWEPDSQILENDDSIQSPQNPQNIGKYEENPSEDKWDMVKSILAVTETNSLERKFLLIKHFLQDIFVTANNIEGIRIGEIKTDEQINKMTEEEFGTHMDSIDVKNISLEERKYYTEKVFERYFENRADIKDTLLPILRENFEAISLNDIDLGNFEIFNMSLDYFGPIISSPQIPVPLKFQKQLDMEIDRLLRAGVIKESNSFYNNSILIVPKKGTESIRIVLDSRKINMGIRREVTIMPRINEILFSMGKTKWFSSLDLISAYWSIPLSKSSTHLTSFSTHRAKYEFVKCVMGLSN